LGAVRISGWAVSIRKSRGFVEPVPSGSQKWTAW
jgi:amidase